MVEFEVTPPFGVNCHDDLQRVWPWIRWIGFVAHRKRHANGFHELLVVTTLLVLFLLQHTEEQCPACVVIIHDQAGPASSGIVKFVALWSPQSDQVPGHELIVLISSVILGFF